MHAEGSTFNAGGTRALARGGAVTARAEDPLVLNFNPAGLAAVENRVALLSLDVPFYTACVEPTGYYGWGVYDPGVSEFGDSGQVAADPSGNALPGQYATERLHAVCNSARPVPIPQLAIAWRVSDAVGVGFGFVGPSAIGEQQWGGSDGTISRGGRAWPSPTRYQLVDQRVTFAFNPTVGVGVRVAPILRLGLAFQWLGLGIESTQVQAQGAGTSPHNDMLVTARASDYFIPALAVSAHATPIEPLDLVVAFQWRDSFDGTGEAVYRTNTYHQGAAPGVPYTNAPLDLSRVHQPLPWTLTVGARWAEALEPRGRAPTLADPDDPLGTELWDVELDVSYQFNARFSKTTVAVEDSCDTDASGARILEDPTGNLHRGCQRIEFRSTDASGNLVRDQIDVPAEGLNEFSFDRHLKDQVVVRLGGSYAIVPRALAVNAGVYYETRGVDPSYASIDAMPFARVGTGVGVVWRVGQFDLMAAYGHVFSETIVVGAPRHAARQSATGDPSSGFDKTVGQPCGLGDPTCVDPQPLEETSAPSDPDGVAKLEQSSFIETTTAQNRVVNSGKYSADFDVFSVGLAYRF